MSLETATHAQPPALLGPLGDDSRDPERRVARLFELAGGELHHMVAVAGGAVVLARGELDGFRVHVFATNPLVKGGALGRAGCTAIADHIDEARLVGGGVIGLWHCGGARIDEGVDALEGMGTLFSAITRASGVVPQVSVILGSAAGGAAYGPALTDVVVMAPEGRLFVTGPDVVRMVTGEVISKEDLGGPTVHQRVSGVAHICGTDQDDAMARGCAVMTLMLDATRPEPGLARRLVALDTVLPARANRAYDVHDVVDALVDGEFHELQAGWARNTVIGFGRIAGGRVGILANNPLRLGGCLTAEASDKAARFVRLCDAFAIPLVVLVDVPGYLPGADQEYDAVLRRGAKLLHAFAAATMPRVTVVMRKAYGGSYLAMNGAAMGATAVLAWPQAEVAVMGAEGAIEILGRRALAGLPEPEREQRRAELIADYRATEMCSERVIESGAVDRILRPAETARAVAEVIAGAAPGMRASRNIPL
ncbi:MAG: acyl-CoA carboxylase subunit beta [Microlunatus sp.]|nr:acyl-CoA carboxylase subunit beta [Microlunatus sp.]